MSFWRRGQRTRTWWAVAVLAPALVAADLYGQIHRGIASGQTALFEATMVIGMLAGLWVWAWRPQMRMGPLMYWWPALTLAGDLDVAYPDSRLPTTIGLALYTMGPIVYAQMTLAYPNGKLVGRLA